MCILSSNLPSARDGLVLCPALTTISRRQAELDSPVVGVYALVFDALYLVPHTTVATETLRALTHDVAEARQLV